MAIEVFNRYENKYMIDTQTFEKVQKVMERYMVIDEYCKNHSFYTISNIYYDTPDDYLIRKSLSKPTYKEKLRLRSYGIPREGEMVYLEIKKKVNGLVNKRRTALTSEEAYDFLKSKKIPEYKDYMNKQVLCELEYFMKIYNIAPKVYIAYDRRAYFEKGNNDLRVSFDRAIRTRRYDLRLEDGDYGKMLIPDNMYLMEIKTSKAIPLWLADMLLEFNIHRSSFSKYGTEFKNKNKLHIIKSNTNNDRFNKAAV